MYLYIIYTRVKNIKEYCNNISHGQRHVVGCKCMLSHILCKFRIFCLDDNVITCAALNNKCSVSVRTYKKKIVKLFLHRIGTYYYMRVMDIYVNLEEKTRTIHCPGRPQADIPL